MTVQDNTTASSPSQEELPPEIESAVATLRDYFLKNEEHERTDHRLAMCLLDLLCTVTNSWPRRRRRRRRIETFVPGRECPGFSFSFRGGFNERTARYISVY